MKFRGNCKQCGKPLKNKNQTKFCSRKCFGLFSRKTKALVEKKCGIEKARRDWSNITLGTLKKDCKDYRKTIRGLANIWTKKIGRCIKCGYDIHTETCHIKPVSAFSDDDLILDINASSNLIELCPNCHWEFDHYKVGAILTSATT